MTAPTNIDSDIDKANRAWEEYERTHDLTGKERLAVGVDSETGEVFLGESALEIGERLKQQGCFRPLFYRWVNSPYYTRMVGRRCPAK